ncbi:hypothetical protein GOODEAATRI_019017 [Goodea atripinnis]|uniref:Uncharacterized protein n=1 Tax=Goodea atripinnis TaxID=208336 RepID=A0ABV0N2L9_9TELE
MTTNAGWVEIGLTMDGSSLVDPTTETLMHALTAWHLKNCSGFLFGLPFKSSDKATVCTNLAVWVKTANKPCEHMNNKILPPASPASFILTSHPGTSCLLTSDCSIIFTLHGKPLLKELPVS